MAFPRRTWLLALAAVAGLSPAAFALGNNPTPSSNSNNPPSSNPGGGVVVDPPPGGNGCHGPACNALNNISQSHTFTQGGSEPGGGDNPPLNDNNTNPFNGVVGGGDSAGGAPSRPGGGGGGDASQNGAQAQANRTDILPGQMDALRGDGTGRGQMGEAIGGAPSDSVTILKESAPQSIGSGGFAGRGGKGRANDLLHSAQNQLRLKDFRGAAATARQLAAEDPQSDKGFTLLALASNRAKDFNAAEEAAKLALKLNPKNSVALQNKAWAQLHERKLVDAIEAADEAIKLKPDAAANYAVKAFAESLQGKKAEALQDLEHAAAIDPRFMGRLQIARSGGTMFDPENDDAALVDDMTGGKAAAGGAPGSPVKIGGLALLVVGLWAGIHLGRRGAGRPKITPALGDRQFPPVRFTKDG